LDALPEEEKSRLESEGGELLKETDLDLDLFLQEGSPELRRAHGSTEEGDARSTDIVDIVDRRLGAVEREGRAARGEEGGDMVDGERIVG
jgi:hypothetical protein